MDRILLVEDNPALSASYAGFLCEYKVRRAASIAEALEAIRCGEHFDLAIVDFWLEEDNAIPILEKLSDCFPEVKVIVISGGNDRLSPETTRALASTVGHKIFLMKPFKRSELLAAIGRVLEAQPCN